MKYAGADWVEGALRVKCSPLGREVADVLGQAFLGIYHVSREAKRVDWSDTRIIEFRYGRSLATYDADELTRLVVLCHECDNPRCVRLDHLFLGSHADNMRDRRAKGRGKVPVRTGGKWTGEVRRMAR